MEHHQDWQIQAYLDHDPSVNRAEMEAHWVLCRRCRDLLAEYRQLYKGLQDEAGFLLSADFADTVLRKVEGTSRSSFDWMESLLLIGALLLSGVAVWYFSDLGGYLQRLAGEGSVLYGWVKSLVSPLPAGTWHLLGAAGLVMGLMALLDRLIFQLRQR